VIVLVSLVSLPVDCVVIGLFISFLLFIFFQAGGDSLFHCKFLRFYLQSKGR